MRIPKLVIASALLLAFPLRAQCQKTTWDRLASQLSARDTVRITTHNGTRIEGRHAQVTPESLTLDVTSSSTSAFSKGQAAIPRQTISVVQVRPPRYLARIVLTAAPIGIVAAASVLGAVYSSGSTDATKLGLIAGFGAGGGAVGGHFLGRAIDRRWRTYTIESEVHSSTPLP